MRCGPQQQAAGRNCGEIQRNRQIVERGVPVDTGALVFDGNARRRQHKIAVAVETGHRVGFQLYRGKKKQSITLFVRFA